MKRRWGEIVVFLLAGAAGCAAVHPGSASSRGPTTAPTTAGVPVDQQADLTLDQILPVPSLPAPATQPADPAPLDALDLYARARDAMLRYPPEHFVAITLLEKAIAIDPYSYDLHFDLGRAYLSVNNMEDRAIDQFEQAERLDPNRLDVQLQLGGEYLRRGDTAKSIEHLRLGLQTDDYDEDEGEAALTDLFLARALQQAGYDRAALDRYEILVTRLLNQTLGVRQEPELAYLIDRPEEFFVEVGELYAHDGKYAQALRMFELAAERDPDDFQMQARVARMLASLGQRDNALGMAGGLVVANNASGDSLALLADVCRRLQIPDGAAEALGKLHAQRPADKAILFALADTLLAQNRSAEALQLLFDAWSATPDDIPLTRRVILLDRQLGHIDQAARVLVIALAHNPNAQRNLATYWDQLLQPSQRGRLKLSTVQEMKVPGDAEAARFFWISRIADLYRRDALVRSALEQAIAQRPPFAPAFRELLNQTWAQDQLSGQQKIDFSNQLSAQAADAGDAALASELKGLSLLNQKQSAAAAEQFAQAMRSSGATAQSPELRLEYALAVRKAGKDPRYEQLLRKLISDHPIYEESYELLFRYLAEPDLGQVNDAVDVLSMWLSADPQNVTARVLKANVDSQLGDTQGAQAQLLQLFAEDPDNSDVLEGLQTVYGQMGKLDEFVSTLEAYRAAHPQDTDVASRLAAIYAGEKKPDEANRVLAQARTAVAGDADLLYSLAQMYAMLDEKSRAEDVLEQVVKIDPTHAGASNDLGFEWADEGKNLPRAEELIRIAVAAEPDNQSFLDSLGWVLYKQGRFDQARKYLEQAIGPAAFPDPVVLDHLGDTLYRLSQTGDAAQVWQRSLKGIGDGEPDREDLRQLRVELQRKIKQATDRQTVDVAPINQ